MAHVAVIHQRYVGPVLSGRKTIEARLMRARVAPFGRARSGERVYFKTPGGPFVAMARIGRVEEHAHLSPARVAELRARLGSAVGAPEEFWIEKAGARFATLMELCDAEPTEDGPDIRAARRAQPRAAWLVVADAPARQDPRLWAVRA